MESLYEKLINYSKSDTYPFHMPGHKRQGVFGNPISLDITEIDSFDNLHHSEGILRDAQVRAAELYGSSETHFLVNGSTCGILSAVSACVSKGGKLLMARNCHKAAYHAAFLNELEIIYLYPEKQTEYNINGEIKAEDIRQCLAADTDIEAVLITSPTYDGVVSNVAQIAAVTHAHGIPLIVDEAHGAHFGFHPYFPESSVKLGADIVIHSLHKTLPSFTQTALLHVNGELVDREKLAMYLAIYQTSSPSYLLMAGMDECIRLIKEEGTKLFTVFAERLERFYENAKAWSNIYLVDNQQGFDRSKLILSVKQTEINGMMLQNRLRDEYGLELEMAASSYALALTSLMDTEEGFSRLLLAVTEIDKELRYQAVEEKIRDTVMCNEVCYRISDAHKLKSEEIWLENSCGRISAEFLYLYPPGIPLLVLGERISEVLLKKIMGYKAQGFSLQGLRDYEADKIQVLKNA